jgi:hypothetical protein
MTLTAAFLLGVFWAAMNWRPDVPDVPKHHWSGPKHRWSGPTKRTRRNLSRAKYVFDCLVVALLFGLVVTAVVTDRSF